MDTRNIIIAYSLRWGEWGGGRKSVRDEGCTILPSPIETIVEQNLETTYQILVRLFLLCRKKSDSIRIRVRIPLLLYFQGCFRSESDCHKESTSTWDQCETRFLNTSCQKEFNFFHHTCGSAVSWPWPHVWSCEESLRECGLGSEPSLKTTLSSVKTWRSTDSLALMYPSSAHVIDRVSWNFTNTRPHKWLRCEPC